VTRILRARWILPIAQPPIAGGWVELDAGRRIVAIGSGRSPTPAEDLGEVALLPGLVNAHTHLELSWLAGRVPRAASMPQWIRSLLAERLRDAGDEVAGGAVRTAIRGAQAAGTVLFGDISNTLATAAPLADAGVEAVVFHEVVGFRAHDPQALVNQAWQRVEERQAELRAKRIAGVAFSVVAHAPYSVSPALFSAIAAARRETPLAVHTGESLEEIEFLQTGSGPFRALLEDLGAWNDAWRAPGCGPIEYLRRVGYLQPGLLAVHGTHLADDELAALREAGGVLVTCPRSNVWVGGGAPPASRFYRAGVPVAIGTDSLASVDTLNLFDELAALRRAAPDVEARRLLESATLIGARALGRADDLGSIEAGKRPGLVAVPVPKGIDDVEEYVVSGQLGDVETW
jgi:cytosine/adenosine deaminase-related metal-dependent hydrolase